MDPTYGAGPSTYGTSISGGGWGSSHLTASAMSGSLHGRAIAHTAPLCVMQDRRRGLTTTPTASIRLLLQSQALTSPLMCLCVVQLLYQHLMLCANYGTTWRRHNQRPVRRLTQKAHSSPGGNGLTQPSKVSSRSGPQAPRMGCLAIQGECRRICATCQRRIWTASRTPGMRPFAWAP